MRRTIRNRPLHTNHWADASPYDVALLGDALGTEPDDADAAPSSGALAGEDTWLDLLEIDVDIDD